MKKVIIVLITITLIIIGGVAFWFFSSNDNGSDREASVEKINDSSTSSLLSDATLFQQDALQEIRDKYAGSREFANYLNTIINLFSIKAESQDGTIQLAITYPELNSFLEGLLAQDESFIKDIHNFKTLSLQDEEMYSFIFGYAQKFCNSEITEELKMKHESIVLTEEDSNSVLSEKLKDYCTEFTSDLLTSVLDTADNSSVTINSEKKPEDFIINCKIGELNTLYIYTDKNTKHKAMLRVNTVLSGSEALKKLAELSSVNNTLRVNKDSTIIFVEYDLYNSDSDPFVSQDNFTFIDDDLRAYKNSGQSIVGLITNRVIEPGNEAKLTTAIVVPQNADTLYWRDRYSNEVRGFKFNGED